jgi:hypothetical protein
MNTKRTKAALVVALWATVIMGSYTLQACCYSVSFTYACRTVLDSPPDDPLIIGEELCYLADQSYDSQVANGLSPSFGFGNCWADTTYCQVAYDCPSGLQDVRYFLPSGQGYANVVGVCDSSCNQPTVYFNNMCPLLP